MGPVHRIAANSSLCALTRRVLVFFLACSKLGSGPPPCLTHPHSYFPCPGEAESVSLAFHTRGVRETDCEENFPRLDLAARMLGTRDTVSCAPVYYVSEDVSLTN